MSGDAVALRVESRRAELGAVCDEEETGGMRDVSSRRERGWFVLCRRPSIVSAGRGNRI